MPDGGYAPLPGLQYEAPLAPVSADEDRYIVLYEYAAQVITMNVLFSLMIIDNTKM